MSHAAIARVDAVVARTREELFAATRRSEYDRIGVEVECIPVESRSGARCPISEAPGTRLSNRVRPPPTLRVLRRVATQLGWRETPSPYGAPIFRAPDGGAVSYEPGGQIEYSAPPASSVAELTSAVQRTMQALQREAARDGIALLSLGIDPVNGIDAVPLQLRGQRYEAMDAYFATIGPAGACMMRQTAALQVTLDAGADPVGRWRLLSALAPYVTAIFANSSRYAGQWSGWQSTRAMMWRRLDPARTGLPASGPVDPAAAYAAFALRAPAMLWPAPEGGYATFGELLARGDVSDEQWTTHLSTLFPEVRPRRMGDRATFEIRSADALPLEWGVVPLVFLTGLVFDRIAREQAGAVIGNADPGLLVRAAHTGIHDADIGPCAAYLYAIAIEGAARLGRELIDPASLEAAREFGHRYVSCGRTLADDALSPRHRPSELGRRPRGAGDERARVRD